MSSIKAQALSLLARRSYFSKELEKKLREKGYCDVEITPVIDELTAQGWLDDADLALRYATRLSEKGYGPKIIAQKLKLKGGIAAPWVEACDLKAFIEKKYLHRLPQERNKVVAALVRRGFPYELIDNALRSITEEMETFS